MARTKSSPAVTKKSPPAAPSKGSASRSNKQTAKATPQDAPKSTVVVFPQGAVSVAPKRVGRPPKPRYETIPAVEAIRLAEKAGQENPLTAGVEVMFHRRGHIYKGTIKRRGKFHCRILSEGFDPINGTLVEVHEIDLIVAKNVKKQA